jgi:RNA polymerase sigma-70 factor, ECF subfamily
LTSTEIEARVARCFREDAGRAVATLARLIGDLELAEDAISDAYLVALERWPRDGFPDNASAWIITTARRRAIDRLRRERVGREKSKRLAALEATPAGEPAESDAVSAADDRLGLIFACTHPALAIESRIALTLLALGGLTTREIADAFLVPVDTMAQRLVRVKRKIRATAIPFDVPPPARLPERLDDVCTVVYLIFNEGYAATSGDRFVREDLCDDAIRLARVLVDLMPQEPEAMGLLALLLYANSRRATRTGADGALIVLADQDRARWDRAAIEEANQLLTRAARHRVLASYQLEAAIAAVHANATSAEATDWDAIVTLYDLLLQIVPSPVAALNRAVAIGYARNPAAALLELDALATGELDAYHLYHVARADALRRLGRAEEARAAYALALDHAVHGGERRFLETKLREFDPS